MKAGEFIIELAKKAGIESTDKALIDVLSKSEFATTELPTSITDSISGNLLTLDAAKNHSEVKKHFYGNALQPINEKIQAAFTEYGFDEATKQEILSDKSTYVQFEKTIKKIAELKSKQSDSGSKTEKAEFEKKINELQAQISTFSNEKQALEQSIRSEYETKINNREFELLISKRNLPGKFDSSIETNIAKQIVEAKLQEKGAKIKWVDGKPILVKSDDESMRLFDNGKELTFDALTDSALAEKQFIKVSDSNLTQNQNGQRPTPNGGQPPRQNATHNEALANLDAALAGFKE